MSTCKAAIIPGAGKPFEIVERPIPTPTSREVLVKVIACGVCHSDMFAKEGIMAYNFPLATGHEVIGTIEKIGEDVDPEYFKPGKRVGIGWHGGHCFQCKQCRKGDFITCAKEKICGFSYDGGYSQYIAVPFEAIAFVPEGLDSYEAAPLMCAGITVYNAMRHSGAVAGDTVIVVGLGGLGHLAVQYAKAMGFRTIAFSTSEDKKDFAFKLGAHHFATKATLNEVVKPLGGAKYVFWTAPNTKDVSDFTAILSPNGRVVLLGVDQEVKIAPMHLIGKRTGVTGHPSGTAMDSEDTLNFSQLTGVKAMIEKYPLTKVNEAYERMISNKARFRVVLDLANIE